GSDPRNPLDTDAAMTMAFGSSFNQSGFSPLNHFQVTEAYWVSQELIGKFTFWDEESKEPVSIIVDDTFDTSLIPNLKELKSQTFDSDDVKPGTIVWTWVNRVWKGIKINSYINQMEEPLYIDVSPNEFQFKGDINLFECK